MLSAAVTVALIGIAAGTAAFTIAKTKITANLRLWVIKRNIWLGSLIGCPYCLSHWLCAIGIGIYRPQIVDRYLVLDLGISWLVAVFIAATTFGIIVRQMKALV